MLSKQSRVLEDAGYVEVRKGAVGRRPRTWFRLTAEGRQAVQGHLAWLAQLEQTISASTRDMQQARPLLVTATNPAADCRPRTRPPVRRRPASAPRGSGGRRLSS